MTASQLSKLELIPAEILDAVLATSDNITILQLLTCSRTLRHLVEPRLHKRKQFGPNYMRWACKTGNLDAIRRAVYYGANVSVFSITGNGRRFSNRKHAQVLLRSDGGSDPALVAARPHVKASTLLLAAKGGHVNTFDLLLELGAQMTAENTSPRQLQAVLRSMLLNAPRDFAARLVNLARKHNLPGLQEGLNTDLSRAIVSRAPLDDCRFLLEQGADANVWWSRHGIWTHGSSSCQHPYQEYTCALSRAILTHNIPLFHLLITHGASLHREYPQLSRAKRQGHRSTQSKRVWKLTPMFAAAYNMAKGDSTMMELCVANGGDVDFQRWSSHQYPVELTPLAVYLHHAQVGKRIKSGKNALRDVQYFLEHSSIPHMPPASLGDRQPLEFWNLGSTRGVEFLRLLQDDEYYGTLCILTRYGGCLSIFKHMMKSSLNELGRAALADTFDPILERWCRLVQLLHANRCLHPDGFDNSADFVSRFLTQTRVSVLTTLYNGRKGEAVTPTLKALLQAGADVGPRGGGGGKTALHVFSNWVRFDNILHQKSLQQRNSYCKLRLDGEELRMDLLRSVLILLLGYGADPRAVHNGETPIEYLEKASMCEHLPDCHIRSRAPALLAIMKNGMKGKDE